jgi:hypothetical protein
MVLAFTTVYKKGVLIKHEFYLLYYLSPDRILGLIIQVSRQM